MPSAFKIYLITLMLFASHYVAAQKNKFAVDFRLSMGPALGSLSNDSLNKWNQNMGAGLALETGLSLNTNDKFFVALRGGINYYQFSFAYGVASSKYQLAYYGLKSELFLSKSFNPKNRKGAHFFYGCAFGMSFHTDDVLKTVESDFRASANSIVLNSWYFSPHLGSTQYIGKNRLSMSAHFTLYPNASPFLFSEMRNSVSRAHFSFKGGYIGISINYDVTLNKNKNPKPPKPIQEVPDVFAKRPTQLPHQIKTHRRRLTLWVYDHGTIDNDTVSLQLNKEIVLSNHCLVREKKKVKLKLDKGENQLILLAHNEGANPPNSCAVIIRRGFRKEKLVLNSSLQHNEGVVIYNQ